MAAEKAKQRRQGLRQKPQKKIKVLAYTSLPSKSNIAKFSKREITGKLEKRRTRAQTAKNSGWDTESDSGSVDIPPHLPTSGEPLPTGTEDKESTLGKSILEVQDLAGELPKSNGFDSTAVSDPESVSTRNSVPATGGEGLSSPSAHEGSAEVQEGEVEEEIQEKEIEEGDIFFLAPEGSGENQLSGSSSTAESDHDKSDQHVSTNLDQKASFYKTLTDMNSKLSKLDTLEKMNIKLEKNISSVKAKVEDVSNSIEAVKNDLYKYDQKWEDTAKDFAIRISKLEKSSQSWENRWELHREAVNGDCKILQASIDSNSKRLLELESLLEGSKKKWESLYKLESKIKKAAENKFQVL